MGILSQVILVCIIILSPLLSHRLRMRSQRPRMRSQLPSSQSPSALHHLLHGRQDNASLSCILQDTNPHIFISLIPLIKLLNDGSNRLRRTMVMENPPQVWHLIFLLSTSLEETYNTQKKIGLQLSEQLVRCKQWRVHQLLWFVRSLAIIRN